MSELLKKEFRLTASPLTYWFLAFSAMTMLPGYPLLVGGFMMCLGLFYTYQFGREQNDIVYSVLLPVAKTDVVRAKFQFAVMIELTGFLLCALLTLVRMTALARADVYLQNAMMNANFVYLGWLLILFGLFNLVFLRGFFKTAYAFGKPFLLFGAIALVLIAAAETLHHLPGLEGLNTTGFSALGVQLGFLAGGALFYLVITWFSERVSIKKMETLDL